MSQAVSLCRDPGNYASFNVKINRLTSISSNKIIKLPIEILLIRPLIASHSPHISCTITEGEIFKVG